MVHWEHASKNLIFNNGVSLTLIFAYLIMNI